ncbi:HlyD family secretion protein [Aurantiacibacter aquimixticola]|uniref:HlyD family secretion protein n=1 Tax=Aurantiacibacter aquimixticola TaxID=1958945 RepID=UPI001F5BD978|nr:HlyD family efflux transporter periplasmic adaptor subunit [Aurantiacibacter aquimixticola]
MNKGIHQSNLEGASAVAIPVSWQTIGMLLLSGLVCAVIFLSLANYSRVETASGTVTPDKGVSALLPTRPGTVVELAVMEGQRVKAGDLLAQIRTEEDSGQDLSSAEQIEQAIARQDASLASQMDAASAAASAQQSQLTAQQAGLRSEISQIQSQIKIQQDLIETAQADLRRAQEVAERGFISQRDLQVREETLLARQQGLSQLNQSLSAKGATLIESVRSSALIAAQARAQSADLAAARAQVGQQAASAEGSRSYAIRAPIAGTVTALTARVGQPANSQTPLMTIIPTGAELQAELAVPSSAIGFVEEGQEVSLAIDAFPYQRFGTIKGEVLTVAESALSQQGANGEIVSVYPVRVKLDSAAVTAFGRSEPLVSGMTLSARIVTEKQSLLEWLFEPLYAVRRR